MHIHLVRDRKGLNCVSWYILFAFCVWDGGRLPTDAEWGFALAGGEEQRPFPWGTVPTADLAQIDENDQLSFVPVWSAGKDFVVASLWDKGAAPNDFPDNYVHTYGAKFRTRSDNAAHIAPVGARAKGNGKWGHADLAGGMYEWMLDEGPIRPGQCDDCANVSWPAPDGRDPNAIKGPPDFEDRWFVGGARSVRGSAWDNALSLATSQTKIVIEWYTSYPVTRTYRALGGRCARDL
jgi:formylglycine-generating enzyme required for sulfatase activity